VYCDFYFVTTKKSHTSFVRAIEMEIRNYGARYGDRERIDTVYFGGGTPSRLHAEEIDVIMSALRESFDLSAVEETTLEANPEDVNPDFLRQLRDLGVDRVSLGIQSFFDSDLEFMNRAHTADQAVEALEALQKTGFNNFTVDLIFGIPDQPPEYWAANLEKAVGFNVPHLSTYGLTIEPRTPLHKQIELGRVRPPEDEDVADAYLFTISYLREAGFEHYEVSNFARENYRSRHNQLYWSHGNYVGFGPSAHSFWWKGLPGRRWGNVRNLAKYEALLNGRHDPVEFKEELDLTDLANEYIMLRLRTSDGVDIDYLENQYGVDLYEERVEDLAWLETEALIHPVRNDRIRLTDEGKRLCDMITTKLMVG
jgi:oxygen-independent coproporphyrinogen-3 oxidase